MKLIMKRKKMGVANDGVVNAINKKGPSRKEVEKEFDKKKAQKFFIRAKGIFYYFNILRFLWLRD